jgi:ligand-binding sensor domain-containing protein
MGTYRGGLARFDPKDGSFVLFKHRDEDPRSLANDEVWVIRGDADGSLWLGTNDGVDRFDPERGIVVEHYDTYHQEGLSETGARALLIDRKGNLWVGSLGGLDLRLRGGGGFVRYRHDDRDPRSISHDIVMALHEDRKGRLWVGTFGGGLNRLDPATGTFTVYRNLPSNVVYGIQEDASGWLWMSTNHGLAHFDPETGHVENFDLTNGLQSLQFRIGPGLRTRGGRMLFASVDGFYAFDPQTLQPERFAPPVVVTAARVLNEPAAPATAIPSLSALRVSHHDKIISFEFAALDFTFPRRNQYAYTLDGFSDGWVQLGTKRDVTFTNLDPGTYVFRVRASNSDGVWSESSRAEQKLIVEQTVWRRPWVQGLAALLLVITIVCVRRSASRWRRVTRS